MKKKGVDCSRKPKISMTLLRGFSLLEKKRRGTCNIPTFTRQEYSIQRRKRNNKRMLIGKRREGRENSREGKGNDDEPLVHLMPYCDDGAIRRERK